MPLLINEKFLPLPFRTLVKGVRFLEEPDEEKFMELSETLRALTSTAFKGYLRSKGAKIPSRLRNLLDLLSGLREELDELGEEELADFFSSDNFTSILRNLLMAIRDNFDDLNKLCYSRAPMISHEMLALLEDILVVLETLRVSGNNYISHIFRGEPNPYEVLERYSWSFQGLYVNFPTISQEDVTTFKRSLEEILLTLKDLQEEPSKEEVEDLQEYASLTFIKGQGMLAGLAITYAPILSEISAFPPFPGLNIVLEAKHFSEKISSPSYFNYLSYGFQQLEAWVSFYSSELMVLPEVFQRAHEGFLTRRDEILSLGSEERFGGFHSQLSVFKERLDEFLSYLKDLWRDFKRNALYFKALPPEDREENIYLSRVQALTLIPFLNEILELSHQVYLGILERDYLLGDLEKLLKHWEGYLQRIREMNLLTETEDLSVLEETLRDLKVKFNDLRSALSLSSPDREEAIFRSLLAIADEVERITLLQEIFADTLSLEEGEEEDLHPEVEMDGLRKTLVKRFRRHLT